MRIVAWVATKVTHGPVWVRTTRVGVCPNDAIYQVATFTFVTIVRTLVPDEVAQNIQYDNYVTLFYLWVNAI